MSFTRRCTGGPQDRGLRSDEGLRLGEGVAEDLLHLVELRLPADQRRRDLDDHVAAVVGMATSASLDAGAVVSAFARAVQLSRPAAYARLDRLRSLLGADLGHARTRSSLHLALLALDRGTP